MVPPATLRVRVVRVVRETPDAHSLMLEPVDADDGFDYRPGQFVTVRVPSTQDGGAARCYSLCSSPHCAEQPRITVKRVAGGHGSNWLCDTVTEGATLEILRPSGAFTPKSLDEDVLLLAGGSGITPVMSILKSCLRAGTGSVALVYANRDEQSVIFRDELAALADEYPDRFTVVHWLESVQGLPTESGIRALVAPYAGREVFVCGPGPLMELGRVVLTGLNVPAERITVERFSSLSGDPFADDGTVLDTSGPSSTVEVEVDGQHHTVSWPRGDKLLDVLLDAGVDAPFSCREGACSACACILLEGEVTLDNNEILDRQDLDEGLILACQARPVTDRVKVTYHGW